MIITMSRNHWINIQQKIISTDKWYEQGCLPKLLSHIGDATLLDLEFKSDKDKMWFILRWM